MDKENKKIKIKKEVFEIIEIKNFKPKPKWFFAVQEGSIWFFGIATTLFGAMAVSTILFVFAKVPTKFNDVTHDNVIKFWIDFIPLIWSLSFIVFIVIADYFFRKTKKGYKYSSIALVLSSVFLSIIIGYICFLIGLGEIIEKQVGNKIPFHQSVQMTKQKIWSQPTRGLMVGEVVYDNGFMFKSKDGNLLKLNLEETSDDQKELFYSGSTLNLIGTTTGEGVFLVCVAIPLDNTAEALERLFFERNKINSRINICKDVRPYNKFKNKILNYEN